MFLNQNSDLFLFLFEMFRMLLTHIVLQPRWSFGHTSRASSYIVGGTKAFLKMLSYQTQLCNYFPSDGNHFIEIYIFFILCLIISCGTERIFPFDGIYMFLFHVETNAFPIA